MSKTSRNKQDTASLEALKAAVAAGQLEKLYIFHGLERYLLENYLEQIRKLLIREDFAEFNHRRFDGENLSVDTLAAACDMAPAFSERALVEVRDFDVGNASEEDKKKLASLVSDLPEYVCLIFVCGELDVNKDGSLKIMKELKKAAKVVEFGRQDTSKLVKWIKGHFAANGKSVDTATAEHLAMMTGGSMTAMNTEIEKLCDSTDEKIVTEALIDALVTPVVETVVYRMTDHIASGNFSAAATVLDELLQMDEKPHYIIFSVTLKLRHLLTARCCLEAGRGEKELASVCGLKYDWMARNLMTSARKTSTETLRQAVLLSTEAAYRMNSGAEPEHCLTELLVRLASGSRRVRV